MKQTNERLCALAQKGDAAALDSLIENNKSFIGKAANDLFRSMNLAQSGLNLDTDDLKQAGNMGLWKAVPSAKVRPAMSWELPGIVCRRCTVRGWLMRWRKCVLAVLAAKRWGALAKDGWMRTFTTSRCWPTTAKCTMKPQRNITWSNHGRNWI